LHWAKKFRVSEERLAQEVMKVGNTADRGIASSLDDTKIANGGMMRPLSQAAGLFVSPATLTFGPAFIGQVPVGNIS
jgi:hypothetical protein